MSTQVDILIPTYNRPAALAVTLASLAAQTFQDFRLLVSDQSTPGDVLESGEVQAVLRVLRAHGQPVEVLKHLPPRGMAEQRQFLLDQVQAPYALYLDDDLVLEPWQIQAMVDLMKSQDCGFVGSAVIGLSYLDDIRPHQQQIELWEGTIKPEVIRPHTPEWERYVLHNAANLYHVQQRLGASPSCPIPYKVAWVGGCVLYDTEKLCDAGGFEFWTQLPVEHCGEDVLAQLRVMARFGGCGMLPSGVYHQELPTTVPDRQVNAPLVLDLLPNEQEG